MDEAGFTKIAVPPTLKALLNKEMLATFQTYDGRGDPTTAYRVTEKGMSWLFANQDKLTLMDDDVPF
jgi:hypothetical protein